MNDARPRKALWNIKPLRIAHAHLKLIAAVALGIILFLLLPGDLRTTTRALIAWNVAVAFYLALALYVITRSDMNRIRRRATEEDEGAALILLLTVLAATASLVAIFAELGTIRNEKASGLDIALALAIVTVVLSWTFIHVIFAFHYAHEFYGEARGSRKGGLQFPADDRPEYWDFVYFSFVIGVAGQVSDVQVTSKPLRRMVVAHGVVSFFYNITVLALMVNIGAEFVR